MDNLAEQLRAQRERSAARRTAEANATLAAGIDWVRRSGIENRARKVGERAPDFALVNATGRELRLGDLLGRGPVVLAFYRGAW